MSYVRDFRNTLQVLFDEEIAAGNTSVTVKASDLHRRVGGYPGPAQRMPACCSAMRSLYRPDIGDSIVYEPPSGTGPRLTIRYVLPRTGAGIDQRPMESDTADGAAAPCQRSSPPPAGQPLESLDDLGDIHRRFLVRLESLRPSLEQLLRMAPAKPLQLPKDAPEQCIYLFSENGIPLYVGRSRKLRQRMRNHCSPASGQNQAVFAFKLAREQTGRKAPGYTSESSRRALIREPSFAAAFAEAKERIRRMELRYVYEADPIGQALLEIYAAVGLGTPYNSFDTT